MLPGLRFAGLEDCYGSAPEAGWENNGNGHGYITLVYLKIRLGLSNLERAPMAMFTVRLKS